MRGIVSLSSMNRALVPSYNLHHASSTCKDDLFMWSAWLWLEPPVICAGNLEQMLPTDRNSLTNLMQSWVCGLVVPCTPPTASARRPSGAGPVGGLRSATSCWVRLPPARSLSYGAQQIHHSLSQSFNQPVSRGIYNALWAPGDC
jgi:hypothetical protein